MTYDQGLAHRLREALSERGDVHEKEMFGGLAFLIGGNMSVGIVGEDLLVRVGPQRHDAALAKPYARIMDFTGRPMKGWIFVAPRGFEEDRDLADWIEWGVAAALSSPKKKPSAPKGPARPAGAQGRKNGPVAKRKAAKSGKSRD
jgi:hypothetical protein